MNTILKHKTKDEQYLITEDQLVIEGLKWGKPRPGHDEGEIYKHVEFIWDNIDRLSYPWKGEPAYRAVAERGGELWRKLRLIALVHDTFKYQVDPKQSKSGENHHAMRARRHAERYPQLFDAQMLDVIELHDDAYNAWCKGSRDNNWDKANDRAMKLRIRLMEHSSLDMFVAFYSCDTHIGDVERPDWEWWKEKCRMWGYDYQYFIAR